MAPGNPLKIATQGCNCEEMTEDQKYARLDEILDLYRSEPGSLINCLYVAQTIFGYLSDAVLKHVAEYLDVPAARVAGVASFYSYFTRQPRGKHVIKVCLGTACYVRGGKQIMETLVRDLGIKAGETTPDGEFTLAVVRCVGACALAPVVLADEDTHRRVRAARISDIIAAYRKPSTPVREAV
ncbi:MAG: NADH-quinone oxidoreductase subunit NuoE [Candidatus Krumholzibacteriia bacterium]